MSALEFAPVTRRSTGRWTAVTGESRYLVEYRSMQGAWTVTLSDADGSHELGRGKTLTEAKTIAQRHAGGRK